MTQRTLFSESLAKSYYTVTGFPEFEEEPPNGGKVLMLLHILGVSAFAGCVDKNLSGRLV